MKMVTATGINLNVSEVTCIDVNVGEVIVNYPSSYFPFCDMTRFRSLEARFEKMKKSLEGKALKEGEYIGKETCFINGIKHWRYIIKKEHDRKSNLT